jgi:hypothetical protein
MASKARGGTVHRMVPGERLEEICDEGDLIGDGTWSFDESNGITTTVYHCAVRANTLSLRLTFKLSWSVLNIHQRYRRREAA